MIHLFNVERDENYIWCNYYPEGREDDIGFIKLDRKNDYKIVEGEKSQYDGDKCYYHFKARSNLRSFDKRDFLPKEPACIMWY